MKNKDLNIEWNELKDIWTNSPKTRNIHIHMSNLFREVKSKTSQFEKDSIKNDLDTFKVSWESFKGNVSEFEKASVKKDLAIFLRLFKKVLTIFNKK